VDPIGKKSTKRYSPKVKFTVVLEVLKSEKSDAEVARAFDVHPATLSRWKQAFLEKGPEVFGGSKQAERKARDEALRTQLTESPPNPGGFNSRSREGGERWCQGPDGRTGRTRVSGVACVDEGAPLHLTGEP